MTSYRYIGYGVTDSNGVAHLDHDPQGNPINGYTGTGAGEVDVIASTDNPISSGSIVSETYNVLDCYVHGITTSDWSIASDTTYDFIDGKHTFTTQSQTTGNKTSTLNTVISGDFKIEFNKVSTPNWTARVEVYSPSENKANVYTLYNQSDATFIIERQNGVFSATLNGATKTPQSTQVDFSSDIKLRIVAYVSSGSSAYVVSFEDLKIYPI